ncbi:MAG TPA: hypothetical protein VJR70_08905 [Stellaceae bacterium]|nr:hypothetical protein [Stellaceae bacterium]
MPRLRIIVAGMAAQYPVGGVAWDYLQYPIGLARLGHDVFYHEDTWCWPYDPRTNRMTDDPAYSAGYLRDFFARYAPDFAERWHYRHLHETSCGMSQHDFDAVARTADLFINVSGASFFPDALAPGCRKIFIDSDPGYNQIVLEERPEWSQNVERWRAGVLAHDRHFTYGENIGRPDCGVPAAGLCWQPTRMPVVLDLWEAIPIPSAPAGAWSTVMTWNVFRGRLEHRGVEYHGKAAEFGHVIGLPRRLDLPFRIAVGGTEAPLTRLAAHGWQAEDGPAVSLTPQHYRDYIAASRGEVSVAKNVYVALNTGWFSCRTACYLAAGRPAVVQDTGFSRNIPTGSGLHAFADGAQAAEAIRAVERDYAREARRARGVARAHFDAGDVLARLIDDAVADCRGAA